MQPEIHATDPPVPASDLLPPQRRKGIPKVTAILGVGLLAAATFLAGIEAQKQWGGSSSSNGGRGNFAAASRRAEVRRPAAPTAPRAVPLRAPAPAASERRRLHQPAR